MILTQRVINSPLLKKEDVLKDIVKVLYGAITTMVTIEMTIEGEVVVVGVLVTTVVGIHHN